MYRFKSIIALALSIGLALIPAATPAQYQDQDQKNDIYDFLRLSTKVALHPSEADLSTNLHLTYELKNYNRWVAEMGQRLLNIIPHQSVMRNQRLREDFLATVFYESARAGLDPQWILALIQVESAFRKYAISSAGARGYMQVMPFWTDLIGDNDDNLFHLRTNLRYGTVILRHYLDIEDGNLYRALGRYNGSLGKPQYPRLVLDAYQKNWQTSS